jgi:CDP-paratose 2-epimerase
MAGAGQFGHPAQGIFAFWIHSFRQRRPLAYIGFGGEGHQVRDCLHPRDLLPLLRQQFAEPTDSRRPRVVNISGGRANSMSLRQLSTWCERRYEPLQIRSVPETRAFDIPWMVLDSRLAQREWNWTPQTPLEQVLSEISIHADEHPDWLDRCA